MNHHSCLVSVELAGFAVNLAADGDREAVERLGARPDRRGTGSAPGRALVMSGCTPSRRAIVVFDERTLRGVGLAADSDGCDQLAAQIRSLGARRCV